MKLWVPEFLPIWVKMSIKGYITGDRGEVTTGIWDVQTCILNPLFWGSYEYLQLFYEYFTSIYEYLRVKIIKISRV